MKIRAMVAVWLVLLSPLAAWAACEGEARTKATSMYTQALEKENLGDVAAAQRRKADAAANWSLAATLYESAVMFCDELPRASLRLGIVRYKQFAAGGDRAGLAAAREALAAGARVGDAATRREGQVYLALCWLAEGDLARAKEALAKADAGDLKEFGAAEVRRAEYQQSGRAADREAALAHYRRFAASEAYERYAAFGRTARAHELALRYGDAGRRFAAAEATYLDPARRGKTPCGVLAELEAAIAAAGGEFPEAHLLAGRIYSEAECRDAANARAHLERAQSLPEGRFRLALLSIDEGDLAGARKLLDSVATEPTLRQAVRYHLACIALQQKNRARAERHLEACLAQDGHSAVGQQCRTLMKTIRPGGEERTGDAAMPPNLDQTLAQYGGLARDNRAQIVQAVVDRIVAGANLRHGAAPYRAFVLRAKEPLAFATRAGEAEGIFVSQGLLEFVVAVTPSRRLDAENDVLAFVLAHELAHLTEKHGFAIDLIERGREAEPTPDMAARLKLSVQRDLELVADQIGLRSMFLAGYDPQGAVTFLSQYARHFGGPDADADHPTFTTRIRELATYWETVAFFGYSQYARGLDHLKRARTIAAEQRSPDVVTALEARYRDAARCFEDCLRVFPDIKQAHNNLGYCHLQLALLHAEADGAGWRIDGAFDPEILGWKVLVVGTGPPIDPEKQLAAAVDCFGAALALDGDYEHAAFNLGTARVAEGDFTGRYDAASAALDRSFADRKLAVLALVNLGVAHAKAGDEAAAVRCFGKALAKDRRCRPAVYNMALLLKRQGNRAQAERFMRQYLELDRDPTGWRRNVQAWLAED